MRPKKKASTVQIPVTFDGGYKHQGLGNDKFIMSVVTLVVWLITAIVALFLVEGWGKLKYICVSFPLVLGFVRYVVMRERYYMKKKYELKEQSYKYDYKLFWDIYEVGDKYPYICRFSNGLKAIFVTLDKDVIVGREEDNDYVHYEAIAEAYLQMHKRGIDCMHIDYMDTVGKDTRVGCLFELANKTRNRDVRDVLTRIYDNVENEMQRSYSSYDVYCFYFSGKDDLFWDELRVVLEYFAEANYLRSRVLNRDEIGELVKSVMNIDSFSVRENSERLFLEKNAKKYLTPIWVERGGYKTVLNKTLEELAEEAKVREVEKSIGKEAKKPGKTRKDKLRKKVLDREEIDLFD